MRERERREKEREMTSRESLKELFSITDNKFSLYLTLYTEREREREREREKKSLVIVANCTLSNTLSMLGVDSVMQVSGG